MKIVVTGGLGFIGRELVDRLVERDEDVTVVDRSAGRRPVPDGVDCIAEDLRREGHWQGAVRRADVVVNLVGASIFRRWTPEVRRAIRETRVDATRNVVRALQAGDAARSALINASAVGIYGFRGDEVLDETASTGDDFLARVAVGWEREALAARSSGSRVVRCRFGIVLGPSGGAADMLFPMFRCMMGSPLGSGRQWFPWIHLEDLSRILLYCIYHPDAAGAINCVAPRPVTNRELTFTLSTVVGRPVLVPFIPAWAIELALGEFGEVLTRGQRAVPQRLQEEGFRFHFPELRPALEHIEAARRG